LPHRLAARAAVARVALDPPIGEVHPEHERRDRASVGRLRASVPSGSPHFLQGFNPRRVLDPFDPDLAAFPLGQLEFANEEADFQQIGGEIGGRLYPVDGLDIYLNYALHETSPVGDQSALAGRELDQRTSAHKINAGVQYRAPFGLDLAVDFSWVSDQVWVEQVLDTARGGTAFVAFPLPSYAVLNARVGWRFFDDQLELAIVGTNLIMEHREHPFGQPVDRRFMGSVTFRY
jgi:iron complex outermembrane receptor protein